VLHLYFSKVFGLPEAQLLEVNYLQMQMISVQHPTGLHILRELYFGAQGKGSFKPVSLQTAPVHCSPLRRKVSFFGVITYLQEAGLLKAFIHLSLITKMFKDMIKAIKRKRELPAFSPLIRP